ncbi:MAG: N-acetylgalactosamine-6-sulfatase [Paracoccaceae bacterium]|nr:MAG: N-acetylgalactosamine-6-sulfatase [Paracoccaceae bacterium]
MTPPNLFLVMTDQQRMDSLSCYGNRFTETPHAAAMADAGMCFDTALTPWPVCTPARATCWTGTYPTTHGVIDNLYGVANAFATHSRVRETVFDRLRAAGHATAHFGKWHLGEARPPFFDHWEESFNSRLGHWVDGRQDGEYRPDRATDAAIRWLDRAPGPFCAVLSFYPPHDPYTAPRRFYAPYRGRGVPFAGYYAAVSALDHNLGRIRAALREAGRQRDTVLVWFSDHGDTFWYRREGEHKFVCTDDALRIPLIFEGPGIAPGSRCEVPVGLQDLAPTLLDLAGLPVPGHMQGRSLKPLLAGGLPPDWRRGFYVQNITHVGAVPQRAWRTGRWKLIVSADGAHRLYDLAADPEEELDIFLTPRPDGGFRRFDHIPDHAPVIEALARAMADEAERLGDREGLAMIAALRAGLRPRLAAAGRGPAAG